LVVLAGNAGVLGLTLTMTPDSATDRGALFFSQIGWLAQNSVRQILGRMSKLGLDGWADESFHPAG